MNPMHRPALGLGAAFALITVGHAFGQTQFQHPPTSGPITPGDIPLVLQGPFKAGDCAMFKDATGVLVDSNQPCQPSASDPTPSKTFTQALAGYSIYKQFLFGTAAAGSAPIVPIQNATQLAAYFNPRDSYGLSNRNGEWQVFPTTFDPTTFTFSPNSLKLNAWISGAFGPGGITAGQIVMKQQIQPGKSPPGQHFIAGEMVAKTANVGGSQPAFWGYAAVTFTGGPNENDFFEQPVSANGVWATNKWVDGCGITPQPLCSTTYRDPTWDGYKSTLPFDAAAGFHAYQFAWSADGAFCTYADGFALACFLVNYTSSNPLEVMIYATVGNQNWGQPMNPSQSSFPFTALEIQKVTYWTAP